MKCLQPQGVITALATPYKNGKIHYPDLARLIDLQLDANVDGVLCAGTTGEQGFLTKREKRKLICFTVRRCLCKVPVYVGVSGSTAFAVESARLAAECGADALLVAPPAFFKCTDDGYVRHVESVYEATRLPIVLYNVPSRAGFRLSLAAVERCCETCNVVAVKDASDCGEYTEKLLGLSDVLCGTDQKLAEYAQKGAKGVVSVTSNVAPRLVKRLTDGLALHKRDEQFERDSEIHRKLAELMFCEVSPIAVKYALKARGVFGSCEMRLPLTEATPETREKIDKFLKLYGGLL